MSYRIKQLCVSGFRGFGRSVELDLDGDVIILYGVNGSGKTSLMDSILWVLTGSIARLGSAPEIVSRYSSAGEARVEAVLESSSGSRIRVIRRHDGKDASLSLQVDDLDAVRGPSAEGALLEALWPDAQLAQDPSEALVRSLTRAVYLQQDAVRDFVEADGEEERFRVVGEIVGAGRAGELSSQLASARNRWSRGTTAVEKEADPRRAQLTQLRAKAANLDAVELDTDSLNTVWRTWLRQAASILGEAMEASDRSRHLDRILTALRLEQGRL
ncbi:MAG: AAA family ATPase, partial [Microthrixaceae bacterium]|nr:AAA family ATPase [Microthrixaceae bacterium]